MIYTVTLNPAIDCLMRVGRLDEGATNRASEQRLAFGGKGINVSRALARLGVPSVALGFAAGFTGEAIVASLADEPLITAGFIMLREGVSRVNVKLRAGAETEINAPGPAPSPEEAEELLDRLGALGEGDVAVFSGSLPEGLPSDFYALAVARVSERGARAAVDTSGAALTACLPLRPFLIKPNRREAEEIFGAGADPADCARRFREAGARNVLLSLGADGAVFAGEDGEVVSLPAEPCAEGAFTVGAGDAMLAGFLAGEGRGADFALKLAMSSALPHRQSANDEFRLRGT